ncbi:MAG: hypothetical protein ACHBN1_08125 [Heteroscytonema crispum UTEX LB 1556]
MDDGCEVWGDDLGDGCGATTWGTRRIRKPIFSPHEQCPMPNARVPNARVPNARVPDAQGTPVAYCRGRRRALAQQCPVSSLVIDAGGIFAYYAARQARPLPGRL